jgi:hypothetical protein
MLTSGFSLKLRLQNARITKTSDRTLLQLIHLCAFRKDARQRSREDYFEKKYVEVQQILRITVTHLLLGTAVT